jgi:hypothetical protein
MYKISIHPADSTIHPPPDTNRNKKKKTAVDILSWLFFRDFIGYDCYDKKNVHFKPA